jgi:hypothetical protein
MNRLHVLALAALAAGTPLAIAGTATFGLFTTPYYKCGKCQICPGNYNAFSPRCYGVENAGGCTACPIPQQYLDGPFDQQFGYARGWHGLGPKGCFGLCGHGNGYPSQFGMPPYPCGALAAFHGVPGGLGCGDPFGGCGTKRPLLRRFCDWKAKDPVEIGLYGAEFGKGPIVKALERHGWIKGGCSSVDGVFESSELIASFDGGVTGGCSNCAPAAPAPAGPAPSALPLPTGVQPAGYYYPAANGGYYFYPVSYQAPGYYPQPYYPMGYYQAPYGYYPGYGFGYPAQN